MSALRQRLRGPEPLLILILFLFLSACADSFRDPGRQLTAEAYIAAVHVYQHHGRGLLSSFIACRYRPTCSEYSIQAVQKYGIRWGLVLSMKRLFSCTTAVPFGTSDPVP